jgi:hypothetical protein
VKVREIRSKQKLYSLKLVDKDFKLPPAQTDINDRAMDKVAEETQQGGRDE